MANNQPPPNNFRPNHNRNFRNEYNNYNTSYQPHQQPSPQFNPYFNAYNPPQPYVQLQYGYNQSFIPGPQPFQSSYSPYQQGYNSYGYYGNKQAIYNKKMLTPEEYNALQGLFEEKALNEKTRIENDKKHFEEEKERKREEREKKREREHAQMMSMVLAAIKTPPQRTVKKRVKEDFDSDDEVITPRKPAKKPTPNKKPTTKSTPKPQEEVKIISPSHTPPYSPPQEDEEYRLARENERLDDQEQHVVFEQLWKEWEHKEPWRRDMQLEMKKYGMVYSAKLTKEECIEILSSCRIIQ